MNTASLSGILTHVGALTDADVRELEKLADSFPYCQTAHVLLAKALHDRGSVLAGQKLRRAATAAADRRVLRRLLLTPPPVAVEPEPETATNTALVVNATGELVTAPEPVSPATSAVSTETPGVSEAPEAPQVTAVTEAPASPEAFSPTADTISEPEATVEQPDEQATEQTAESQPTAAIEQIAEPEIVAEAEPEAASEPEPTPETAPQAEVIASNIEAPLPTPVAASLEPETEESDPANAPAPAIADFDLVPDTSPAAVDLLLFAADELSLIPVGTSPAALALFPEAVADAAAPTAATPTIPALAPDHLVWYAMANSRMGIELTAADFAPIAPTEADSAAESVSETVVSEARSTEFPNPAPELLAEWLPTAPPDARWAEHEAAHRPPPPPRRPFDYQFALIDRFLREKPRLRTVDPTRPLPEKLPDLAQRAARPDSEVVSESMARILARQGKTARAISMYEQLQARLPEKAAIFAAQITALRGAAE